ncbi:GumC family protein [Thalassovita aquimarina]|uniref:Chain-length determining protein n=1 Tax=Thalassovita aquimarina TaxID=2785917 RepID=A0ABS5HNM6_9RHOB|nr:Wzz/FepE/Etk N-terminal domain-containing protein [Thalassovita aquimarina]MBR9650559.1 chain-length determining protein [Thalassovita aquimarina]
MNSLLSLSSLRRALKRRALLIATVFICGTIMALLFAIKRPAVFEATAVIQIEAPKVTTNLASGATVTTTSGNRLKLIEQKLMSRDSILAVIEKFDLFGGDAAPSDSIRVGLFRDSVQITELIDPAQAWRPDVQPSGLSITVRLGDARKAADIANELLAQVLAEGKKRSEIRASQTLAFFETEEARIGAEIEALSLEFARFKERNAASLPGNTEAQQDQLSRLQETQLEFENRFVELETNSSRLRAEERQRQSELLSQQLSLVETRIADIEKALAAAPEVERLYRMMERELEQLQGQYSTITTRRTEAAMAQQLESQNQFERFEVLETALVPEYPVSSGKKKMVLAGAIASLLVGLGLGFIFEWFSPVLRTSEQVERELGLRPVVIIPVLQKPQTGWRGKLGLRAA